MMLSFKVHVLDGPDFLDAVADAEEGLGNLINAAEYRRRARQWRNERLDAEAAVPQQQLAGGFDSLSLHDGAMRS